MQITYQKNNGCIIYRKRNTPLQYKIGDTTSMGWKVLNIEYEYNNKFYSEYNYNMLLNKNRKAFFKRKHTLELITREFKTFLYYFIALLLINLLKMLVGI
jgi:hypothetical protein